MFDNIILHVVAKNDRKIFNSRGEEILTTELCFEETIYDKYLSLVNNPFAIACHEELAAYSPVLLRNWIDALIIERLEAKSEHIESLLVKTGNDWEETFYNVLARYFGFRVNTGPFEMLARALPVKIIRRHSDNRFQVEALLYGTAGMLSEGLFRDAINDTYYRDLTREYKILSSKYSLQPLHGWIWKFARLRPANFPTIRISQLAGMLSGPEGLFSKIIEIRDIDSLRTLFGVKASSYWDDHYTFGTARNGKTKKTGEKSADIIIINAVVPVLYVYGKQRAQAEYSERAVSLLEQTEYEDNSVIRDWCETGISIVTALESQALLQLRDCYCRKRRCLDCRVGFSLLSSGKKFKEQDELILEP